MYKAMSDFDLDAEKHSPLQVCKALSDCVHEQVAKRIVNVRFTLRSKVCIKSGFL